MSKKQSPSFDSTGQTAPVKTPSSREMLNDINNKINKRREMFDDNRQGKKSVTLERGEDL